MLSPTGGWRKQKRKWALAVPRSLEGPTQDPGDGETCTDLWFLDVLCPQLSWKSPQVLTCKTEGPRATVSTSHLRT